MGPLDHGWQKLNSAATREMGGLGGGEWHQPHASSKRKEARPSLLLPRPSAG
jgi:hypothetical protein